MAPALVSIASAPPSSWTATWLVALSCQIGWVLRSICSTTPSAVAAKVAICRASTMIVISKAAAATTTTPATTSHSSHQP